MKFKLTPGITQTEALRELERAVNIILERIEMLDAQPELFEPPCTCDSAYTGLSHAPYCPRRS
jgi:hypothetical protein